MSYFEKYEDCVNWTKSYFDKKEMWIFQDHFGDFHSVEIAKGQEMFDQYVDMGWIAKARVFTEAKIVEIEPGVEE